MTSLLTALLGRLPLGWLQLMRNRTRLVAAVGGVAFANVLIFMQLGFMNALFETGINFPYKVLVNYTWLLHRSELTWKNSIKLLASCELLTVMSTP